MTWGIVGLSVLIGLVANETCDIAPWLARRLTAWAARLRYRSDPERLVIRTEELQAVINDVPGKLFKLARASAFAGGALAYRAKERPRHTGSRNPRTRLRTLIQDTMIYYSNKPTRAVVGFYALLLNGTVIFALYPPQPLSEVPDARLNPFLYTLDLLIPIADFGQRALWNPNVIQHVIGSAIVVLGWTLASIIVIGLTRSSVAARRFPK